MLGIKLLTMHFNIELDDQYEIGFPIEVYWKPILPDLYPVEDYTLIGNTLEFDVDFTPWQFPPDYPIEIVVMQNDIVIYLKEYIIE